MLFADDSGAMIALLIPVILYGIVIIGVIAGLWKVFEKAGQPGWAAIVPIYNLYILIVEVAKMEIIWFILSFIPCISIIPAIMAALKVAEKFGKGAGFGVGLIFLPFIFYPILGFGDAEYLGGKRRKKRRRDEDEDEDEEEDERKW